jgi:DNA-binding GntR family transcriptional regulator
MARPASGHLLSFAESMGEAGIAHVTSVITQEVRQASALCAKRLQMAEGEDYLYLERVRSVAGQRVMYIESHLNLLACPGLDKADFSQESVFAAVERTSGRSVGASQMTYSACVAGKARGVWLECDEHAPVLNCDQLVCLDDGTPFEWGSVWLPANRCVIFSRTSRA